MDEWRVCSKCVQYPEEHRCSIASFYAWSNATFALSVLLKRSEMAALCWIAHYPKTFSLRNFCIDCATNSLPLSVCKYTGIRPSLFASTRWKAFITQLLVLSRNGSTQTYLLSTSIITNYRNNRHCYFLDFDQICLPHIINVCYVCYVIMQSRKFSAQCRCNVYVSCDSSQRRTPCEKFGLTS